MIENEENYKSYLRNVRGLTDGTVNSYPTYLQAVSNHLQMDITSETIKNSNTVSSLLERLRKTGIDKNYWGNCQSALRAYYKFLNYKESYNVVFPDEVESYIEGSVKQVQVNRYERDRKAREACIQYHKPVCKVCNFNFFERYGALGEGFIHVHHVIPLSDIGQSYIPDPIKDLVPVCPNCHAMLHKSNPPLSVDELKGHLKKMACSVQSE